MAIQSDPSDTATAAVHVGPSPHFGNRSLSTRRMMFEVLGALAPVTGMAIYLFRVQALKLMAICVVTSLLTEWVLVNIRRQPLTLRDGSALVTGLILALSLPATAPWYVAVMGSVTAIGLGKMVYGGFGMNIFNPAMVGRAFVTIAFAGAMSGAAYIAAGPSVDILSQATPLTQFKYHGVTTALWNLVWGATNGSLGETSALACIAGGAYLCIRRIAAWQIPAGMMIAVAAIGALSNLSGAHPDWTAWHHIVSGAMLFGAFFIATDPVSSPLTPRGRFLFGAGVGTMAMVLRLFSSYPEGVMFAVLAMNAVTPLINKWTIPRPMGGEA